MSSIFTNNLRLAGDLISSQFQREIGHIKAAETEIPTSDHAHVGNDNIYLLTRENMNFQMLHSANNLIFVSGHDNNATFEGGGAEKIYDNGSGLSVILHNQPPTSLIEIFNSDHDSRFQLYLYNWTDQSIKPDGHGGTLVGGNVDIVDASIPAAKVHFVSDPTWVQSPVSGLFPIPPHADY